MNVLQPSPASAMPAGSEDPVILVDEDDREIGTASKSAVHRSGQLHRAVSVFVFNRAGEMLLQRRAESKYHSAGLWSNSCCGHPWPGETPLDAARRRLREELGIECVLRPVTTFTYRADVGTGLVEHEVDHVFTGRFEGTPAPNPGEVAEWKWMSPAEVEREGRESPSCYTAWLPLALAALSPRS